MLVGSVLALYWLQPLTPIRHLDFWLPTTTLALTVWVWAATQPAAARDWRPTLITAGVVGGIVVAIGLTRYLGPVCCLTPDRPPGLFAVLTAVAIIAAAAVALARLLPGDRRLLAAGVVLIAGLLLTLKAESLARMASGLLRGLAGQQAALASAADLRWLGFSYVAFRLVHVLRDRAGGRLPELSLREFVTYVTFFPAYTAGPIDRAERFVKDYRLPFALAAPDVVAAGTRLAAGVFKKFVLADSLAAVALNGMNAAQTDSAVWMWVLLYAFAWRLYLDFAGYSDIAIGLGRLLGVKLPENFDRPYLRQNLTLFWNSWHITLAQWFRAYVFNPLARALRGSPARTRDAGLAIAGRPAIASTALIILVTQFTTMILIGLWHGVAWNFVAWGAWHGAGLFLHNRWADYTRPRSNLLDSAPRLKRAAGLLGVVLTFHYVALGWVWFALPDLGLAWVVFQKLLRGY